MDDIPSVTAPHVGARNQQVTKAIWVLGMTCLHRELLPHMDDIPSVTPFHDGARNQQVTNANWVLGMTCLHRELLPHG